MYSDVTDLAVVHDSLRPLMFSIAYRMLGSVAEAEDVVQDAFVRMHTAASTGTQIESPEAFATTVTTRLAIDALRSARVRRERYVGPWLPEPWLTSGDEPAMRAETADTLSSAFLVVLETLSPLERAVFLLREVFQYDYEQIARIVERSETNCRQLMTRARRSVEERRPRFEPSREQRDRLAEEFLRACRTGDIDELERLLADDVMFHGDGGGQAPARRVPVTGSLQVARFLAGLVRYGDRLTVRYEFVHVNGAPGIAVHTDDGVVGVMSLIVADNRIQALHNVINPDKLQHLGPVGDITGGSGRTPGAAR